MKVLIERHTMKTNNCKYTGVKASQGALVVKNPPASAADMSLWVWSLGQGNPLEEGIAAHSRILAWRIPWTEEPGGLQSTGLQRVRHDWSDLARTHTAVTILISDKIDFEAQSTKRDKVRDFKMIKETMYQKDKTSINVSVPNKTDFLKYMKQK